MVVLTSTSIQEIEVSKVKKSWNSKNCVSENKD